MEGEGGEHMARAIWTGSLSFGLVNVPVGLFSATEDRTIHFNQFEEGTADRIRYKRVNERTGEEVDFARIVKGYDLGGGEYVLVTNDELEAVEPGRSRTIEIEDFVELADIDPIFYNKTYYLAPQGEGAERAYALLRQAMLEEGKVGVATLVMRGKQYLVAIRPEQDVLALETMYFADEVRNPVEEIDTLPVEGEFKPRELEAAKLLISSMTSAWEPERYHDTYRQQVEELIERKRRGETVVTEAARAEPAPVADLMAALQASVEAARQRRVGDGAAPATKPAARRRRPAAVDDLAGATKADLAGRAARLEIAGRSKMSRDELEAAVRDAEAAGTRRRRAS